MAVGVAITTAAPIIASSRTHYCVLGDLPLHRRHAGVFLLLFLSAAARRGLQLELTSSSSVFRETARIVAGIDPCHGGYFIIGDQWWAGAELCT